MKKIFTAIIALSMIFPVSVYGKDNTGWVHKNKHTYYYVNNQPIKGLKIIKNRYYYFNKKGIMKTGQVTHGADTYYLNTKGVMELRKNHGNYFNKDNKHISDQDGLEYVCLYKAGRILKRITKPSMSKKQKLKKACQWINKWPYKMHRPLKFQKGWTAIFANDHFSGDHRGDCRSNACALAYFAHVIGYKKVYVYTGSTDTHTVIHSWMSADGHYCDPLMIEKKGFGSYWYKNKNFPFRHRAVYRIKVPWAKMKPVKTKLKKGKKKIVWFSKKYQVLRYSDGSIAKGIHVFRHKFYAFNKDGVYDQGLTKKLRAVKEKNDIKKIEALLGKPKRKEYSPSCHGSGDDGFWYYPHIKVFTYKDQNHETFAGAEER